MIARQSEMYLPPLDLPLLSQRSALKIGIPIGMESYKLVQEYLHDTINCSFDIHTLVYLWLNI